MCYSVSVTRDEVRRVIGYVRVSTSDQGRSGLGLEAQVEAINLKARSKGWEVVRIAKDVASGKTMNGRHELQAALSDLKAHRADALVATKLDRISRSTIDFATLLETASKQRWHVVMLELDMDTSTPTGKLIAGVLANVAQFEREMIGQRTREALAVAKARGTRLGRARLITPDLEKRILRMRRSGKSYEAIAEKLNGENIAAPAGGTWGWTTISRVVARAQPVKHFRLKTDVVAEALTTTRLGYIPNPPPP